MGWKCGKGLGKGVGGGRACDRGIIGNTVGRKKKKKKKKKRGQERWKRLLCLVRDYLGLRLESAGYARVPAQDLCRDIYPPTYLPRYLRYVQCKASSQHPVVWQ